MQIKHNIHKNKKESEQSNQKSKREVGGEGVKISDGDGERIRLEGKVAIITGEASAKVFAQHGAEVVITDIQLGQSVIESIGPSLILCPWQCLTILLSWGNSRIRVNCLSPYGVSTPLANNFGGHNKENCEEFENQMNLVNPSFHMFQYSDNSI
ncbi:hypothetical protein ACOSQ2_029153 [Xanthoceras sorbifolium]